MSGIKKLCVVPSYMPAIKFGGPVFSVHELNKALVKKGMDVTVYTTNAGLDGEVPANREVELDGVKVTYFSFVNSLEFLGPTGWQYSPPLARALEKNVPRFDIVYIVAVWNYPVWAAARYAEKSGKPYVVSPRGLLYPYTFKKKSWKKLPYYHLVVKGLMRAASAVHYTSRDEADACHPFLGLQNRAAVIPNGIDPGAFASLPSGTDFKARYGIPPEGKVILFLGRLNYKKGLDILVDAFGMLLRERRDAHLVIAGGDEEGYGGKVKEWIRGAGLSYRDGGHAAGESVIFTGMLEGREKLAALSAGDLFVLPSYSENFGMAAVEAMAAGLPVVISDQVGISNEVRENGAGVVVDASAGALCGAMKLLLDDDALRRRIAENGKRTAKGLYDIDGVADKMAGFYAEAIAGGR